MKIQTTLNPFSISFEKNNSRLILVNGFLMLMSKFHHILIFL